MANSRTKYTEEFRRESADYAISTGKPVMQVAKEIGLNSKTLSHWVQDRKRELSGEPDPKAANAELLAAQKRIRELEKENEFLKKPQPSTP